MDNFVNKKQYGKIHVQIIKLKNAYMITCINFLIEINNLIEIIKIKF